MPFRPLILLALLLLPGCEAALPTIEGMAAVNIGSVMVIGRTVPDAVVSAVTGRDCSAVRLDRGLELLPAGGGAAAAAALLHPLDRRRRLLARSRPWPCPCRAGWRMAGRC